MEVNKDSVLTDRLTLHMIWSALLACQHSPDELSKVFCTLALPQPSCTRHPLREEKSLPFIAMMYISTNPPPPKKKGSNSSKSYTTSINSLYNTPLRLLSPTTNTTHSPDANQFKNNKTKTQGDRQDPFIRIVLKKNQ